MSAVAAEPERLVDADEIPIDDVVVTDRARTDLGDLTELMTSIELVGLLQPIGLDGSNRVLCGACRYEAVKRLGWQTIPYVVASDRDDLLTRLRAEREENTSKERQRESGRDRRSAQSGDRLGSADPNRSGARTNDVLAEALGISPATYKRAKTVVAAAGNTILDAEVRAVAEQARADMDARVISITTAANRVRDAKRRTARPEPTPTPIATAKSKSGPKPNQPRNLRKLTERLAGLTVGVDGITVLDDEVTPNSWPNCRPRSARPSGRSSTSNPTHRADRRRACRRWSHPGSPTSSNMFCRRAIEDDSLDRRRRLAAACR